MVLDIFLTILDDYSRHVWIVMMKTKLEDSEKIKSFVLVENQFEKKVKSIRSDNGPEFLMQEFYAEKGILHQRSYVYTPQQNGRIEIRHQHILNISRALMFQSKLPKKLWSYAVLHAVFF
jgi:transposase InsO family protein